MGPTGTIVAFRLNLGVIEESADAYIETRRVSVMKKRSLYLT